jgi:hypothetical protein
MSILGNGALQVPVRSRTLRIGLLGLITLALFGNGRSRPGGSFLTFAVMSSRSTAKVYRTTRALPAVERFALTSSVHKSPSCFEVCERFMSRSRTYRLFQKLRLPFNATKVILCSHIQYVHESRST